MEGVRTSETSVYFYVTSSLALQPNVGLRLFFFFFFLVSQSHTIRRTAGLFWTSDQPVAEASTYTGQHNIRKRRTSMPSVGFEPAIPVTKLPQTYALDRATTGIGACTRLHGAMYEYVPDGCRFPLFLQSGPHCYGQQRKCNIRWWLNEWHHFLFLFFPLPVILLRAHFFPSVANILPTVVWDCSTRSCFIYIRFQRPGLNTAACAWHKRLYKATILETPSECFEFKFE
jgi:hypothetical protein